MQRCVIISRVKNFFSLLFKMINVGSNLRGEASIPSNHFSDVNILELHHANRQPKIINIHKNFLTRKFFQSQHNITQRKNFRRIKIFFIISEMINFGSILRGGASISSN